MFECPTKLAYVTRLREFDISFEEDHVSDYLDKELIRPMMLQADGLNLIEDVGGIGGYQVFLIVLFNLKPIYVLGTDAETKYIDINA